MIVVKKIIFIVLILSSMIISAQKLANCAFCSETKYNEKDISENKLFELELLRNEIFARHNYSFGNRRLEEFFSKYEWYTPDYNNPIKDVALNEFENYNIKIFKKKEKKIKDKRNLMIDELNLLKKALNREDEEVIKAVSNGMIPEQYFSGFINEISEVLEAIDVRNINWHKSSAMYSIEVDNGSYISAKGIYLDDDGSLMMHISSPMRHSFLMKNDDAFEYPSDYYSESESSVQYEFAIRNGKLVLIREPQIAG